MENEFMVYVNGKYLPAHEASVSVFDRGLNYGDGVFETLRTYNGEIFALRQHIKRLRAGANQIAIPLKDDESSWGIILKRLLLLNGFKKGDSTFRITITRGTDFDGLNATLKTEPTMIVINRPISPSVAIKQKSGIRGTVLDVRGVRPYALANIKSLNFLPNVLGKMEVSALGFDEGFFLNLGGTLTEGTTTNIFLIKGGELITPPLEDGLLPGVTRGVVIDLAKQKGFEVSERSFDTEAVLSSEEAFVTNSVVEITPLIELEERPVGKGRPGKKTKKLQKAYKKLTVEK
jgi:branched-chain amino acid aminotransferase